MDFAWPANEVWKGYINPHYTATSCPDCGGEGYSPEARHLKNLWYGYVPFKPENRGSRPFTPQDAAVRAFAENNVRRSPDFYGSNEAAILREAQRLCDLFNGQWSHHLNADDVKALFEAGRLRGFETPPTPEDLNMAYIGGLGHDAINQWVVCDAECKRLGVSNKCARCDGHGDLWASPEAKAVHDAWEAFEPPAGDGFQLWETTSEGSPVSPVFATLDELCRWAEPNASTFASEKATAAQWREMLETDNVHHREGNILFI